MSYKVRSFQINGEPFLAMADIAIAYNLDLSSINRSLVKYNVPVSLEGKSIRNKQLRVFPESALSLVQEMHERSRIGQYLVSRTSVRYNAYPNLAELKEALRRLKKMDKEYINAYDLLYAGLYKAYSTALSYFKLLNVSRSLGNNTRYFNKKDVIKYVEMIIMDVSNIPQIEIAHTQSQLHVNGHDTSDTQSQLHVNGHDTSEFYLHHNGYEGKILKNDGDGDRFHGIATKKDSDKHVVHFSGSDINTLEKEFRKSIQVLEDWLGKE